MLNESDIMNLLQEYIRTPEVKKWLSECYNVKIDAQEDVVKAIQQELANEILIVLPNFNVNAITYVKEIDVHKEARYSVIIDSAALRRESLYRTLKNGNRIQGEGIDDILSLFSHGYTLKHRAPYGTWERSDGSSIVVGALSHRNPNPFLQNLCKRLNAKYGDSCTITLNDDYII